MFEVQSISLTLKPSKLADNAFKRLIQNIGMYLYIWINIVTLIRVTRNGAALASSSSQETRIVSMQATIKPASQKKPASPTAVMEVLP